MGMICSSRNKVHRCTSNSIFHKNSSKEIQDQHQSDLILTTDQQITQQLFECFYQFRCIVEQIGPLDDTNDKTRRFYQELIVMRSNMMIIIKKTVKKELNKLDIHRRPIDGDQFVLFRNKEFQDWLSQEMDNIEKRLERELSENPVLEAEFEQSYQQLYQLKQDIHQIQNQSNQL